MHIAVFYQYYHNPDCAATGRHYTFLKHWAARHEITLITTRTWYDRRLTHRFDWVPPGVRLHMLDVPYHNAMNVPQRLRAFLHYAAGALFRGLATPRPDVILGSSTPLTAAWVAARVARLRGVPWVFEVRDLWPDFPIQMGGVRNLWLQQRLYALERRLYNEAARVVTLSPDMEAHVRRLGVPPELVTTLVNGTDFALLDAVPDGTMADLRAHHGLAGKQVVLYAGTFGRANDIPTLLTAIGLLAANDRIRFVLAGHGYHEESVRSATHRLPNLIVLPPQPRHRMMAWFHLADLSLVPFIDRPVLAANSPAKFFDSLGAGTPVVVTNPGWTRAFVEEHRCGWYAPSSDPTALADTVGTALADPVVLAEAGRQATEAARRHFDRVTLAAQFERILIDAVAR